MHPTYPAILRNGQLDWGEAGAPPLPPNDAIPVHVTLLSSEGMGSGNGPAMAAALEAIAAAGGVNGIADPMDWQRKSRTDRPLPGRTE